MYSTQGRSDADANWFYITNLQAAGSHLLAASTRACVSTGRGLLPPACANGSSLFGSFAGEVGILRLADEINRKATSSLAPRS
jgi:hypothetical protein